MYTDAWSKCFIQNKLQDMEHPQFLIYSTEKTIEPLNSVTEYWS